MAQVTELAGHVLGGKYRLVRPVSDGPRQVYEARHERLAGRFAVKLWSSTTPWEAFRRGAELAVTLRHPGIVQVIDFNCEPGTEPFLVLEWVDGTRLSDVIAESGILPIERAAPLIESAAWALAAAHQQGIVHQELRPDELTIVHAAGTTREWVKLGGFGVAAALARAGLAPPSRYRAPEQRPAPIDATLRDDQARQDNDPDFVDDGDDPQSDQYALAAIAYEMLTGVPPFGEDRSSPEPLPISDLAPGANPALDVAIRKALAVEPEQRFADVLEFARALRAAAEGATPQAVRERSLGGHAGGHDRVETVSPFFNPVQGASEAFRRVRTTTARLRALAGARLKQAPLLPLRSSARIAIAAGALLLAFTGAAVVMGRLPRRAPADVTAAAPRLAPAAAAPAPPAPAPPASPPPSAPTVASGGDDHAADVARPESAAPKDAPARKDETVKARPTKLATKLTPKAAKNTAGAAATSSSTATSAGSGPCAITVGSHPAADVWIDEHSLGLRTPIIGYRLACGDHKLALKRTDLDIYQMEIITLREGEPFKKVYPLQ